jgi:hypothetical protein
VIPLNARARRTRLLAVGEDLAVSADTTPGAFFACHLHKPSPKPAGGSPRDRRPGTLTWRDGPILHIGSRVELWADQEWELVGEPAPVRSGLSLLGSSAEVLPLAELYPRIGTLQLLGGGSPIPDVPFAAWQPTERDTDRGTYADYLGEVPVEYEQALEPNRQLLAGTETLKIGRASIDYETPRIQLELTRG